MPAFPIALNTQVADIALPFLHNQSRYRALHSKTPSRRTTRSPNSTPAMPPRAKLTSLPRALPATPPRATSKASPLNISRSSSNSSSSIPPPPNPVAAKVTLSDGASPHGNARTRRRLRRRHHHAGWLVSLSCSNPPPRSNSTTPWPRTKALLEKLHRCRPARRVYSLPASDAEMRSPSYLSAFASARHPRLCGMAQPPQSSRAPSLCRLLTGPYNGDDSGRRYSSLSQINQTNVNQLTVAWIAQIGTGSIKSTPLEVDGRLYFTAPDNVWSMDARTGRMIWHYERRSEGDHIGNRGVGMYKDWLYFATPDCHLVSVDARNGKVRWDIELADPKLGYFCHPRAARHPQPRLSRRLRRRHRCSRLSRLHRPRHRQTPVALVQRAQARRARLETWPQGTGAIAHGGGMPWMTKPTTPN